MILFVGDKKGLDLFPLEIAEQSVDVIDNCRDIESAVSITRSDKRYDIAVFDINFFEKCSDDKLLQAFYLFSHTSSARLIILAQGRTPGNRFLSDLIDMNQFNFVTALSLKLATQQFAECIRGRSIDDVSAYSALKPAVKEKKNFFSVKSKKEAPASVEEPDAPALDPSTKKFEIPISEKTRSKATIGIAGVYPRIGTTTQALRLTKHITDEGVQACYIEANQTGHVSIISTVFSEVKQSGSAYLYNGLTMYSIPSLCPCEDFSIIIYDCGADIEGEIFKACDIHIIIAGSTAWEMAALAQELNRVDSECKYIFSFTSPSERDDILSFMAERWKNTFFAEFSPDMFSPLTQDERTIYKKIVNSKILKL